jgi:hypothetical protein
MEGSSTFPLWGYFLEDAHSPPHVPLARTESHGRAWLQGKLGHVGFALSLPPPPPPVFSANHRGSVTEEKEEGPLRSRHLCPIPAACGIWHRSAHLCALLGSQTHR